MLDVTKVIKIAEAEVGYLEKKSDKDLDSKTANAGYNNYTKYGKEMHKIYPSVMDFPAPWCDCFVDWCFYKAYGITNAKGLIGGNFDDYTVASAQLYKNVNAWHKVNPKKGDQIFFKDSKGICHTGLVYAVDTNYVYTIEGNTSGANNSIPNGGGVAKKKYLKTSAKIAGYGRPNYNRDAVEPTPSPKPKAKAYTGTFPSVPPNLKKGSKGQQVKNLQKYLNWFGAYGLEVDGDFGTKTQKAVKDFQKRTGLAVDGIFGKNSLAMAKEMKK